MNDEKEYRLFRAVVKGNLARIAEHVAERMPHASPDERQDRLNAALWVAFCCRDEFDPAVDAWITWFSRRILVDVNLSDRGSRYPWPEDLDEPAPRAVPTHAPEFGLVGTPLNLNALPRGVKDCPPCWRCRYFDGWLPADEDEVEASSAAALEPEIAESCLRLDRNKVRIANWVRGMGWENLEDDE